LWNTISASRSAAKVALSSNDQVEFRFSGDGIDIRSPITRGQFESWITEDLARIAGAVDEVLIRAGLEPEAIDQVFLTGGTSFVPAVQQLFTERFGSARLATADQFESIAKGLALIGQTADPAQWVVSGEDSESRPRSDAQKVTVMVTESE
jgi:hypothetical chaperone protein